MNLERGFKRLTYPLAVIGAIGGFFLIGALSAELFDLEGKEDLMMALFVGAPIGYGLVWCVYYLLRWIVSGFSERG